MSNLKKAVSLVLVLAMVFSLAAGALENQYTKVYGDSADISHTGKHDEAIQMMADLGIMVGNDANEFMPAKTLTRAEMAKILYVLATGKATGFESYADIECPFEDIDGAWYTPYVKFCFLMGYTQGKTETTYAPNDTLTGFEAAKMLLAMLGYKTTNEPEKNWVANWKEFTTFYGTKVSAFDMGAGLPDYALAVATTREDVAVLIYNILFADVVKYVDGAYDEQYYTLIEKQFSNYKTSKGIIVANDEVAFLKDGKAGANSFKLATADEKGNAITLTFGSDVAAEWVGQSVTVNYRETLYSDGTHKAYIPYGVFTNEDYKVVTVEKNAIAVDAANKKITITDGDTTYAYTYSADEWAVKIPVVSNWTFYNTVAISDLQSVASIAVNNDDTVTLTMTTGGKILYVNEIYSTFGKVIKVSDDGTKATINGYNADDKAAEIEYTVGDLDGAVKGDYVLFFYNNLDGKIYADKADRVTKTPTSMKDGKVYETVDGASVQILFANGVADPTGALITNAVDFLTANKQYVYMVGSYVYKSEGIVADPKTSSDILYAVSNSSNSTAADGTAEVVLASGAKITVTIAKGAKKTEADNFYKYIVSDGKYYISDALDTRTITTGAADAAGYAPANGYFEYLDTGVTKKIFVGSSTPLFFYDIANGKYTAINKSGIKTAFASNIAAPFAAYTATGGQITYVVDGGNLVAALVRCTNANIVADLTNATSYAMLTSAISNANVSYANGVYTYAFSAIVNGVKKDLSLVTGTSVDNAALVAGAIVKITETGSIIAEVGIATGVVTGQILAVTPDTIKVFAANTATDYNLTLGNFATQISGYNGTAVATNALTVGQNVSLVEVSSKIVAAFVNQADQTVVNTVIMPTTADVDVAKTAANDADIAGAADGKFYNATAAKMVKDTYYYVTLKGAAYVSTAAAATKLDVGATVSVNNVANNKINYNAYKVTAVTTGLVFTDSTNKTYTVAVGTPIISATNLTAATDAAITSVIVYADAIVAVIVG